MKIIFAIALLFVLTGCASVKDQNGKVVGKCYGASCVLRAALGANKIDPGTGLMEGQIPLFTIGGSSSVPETKTTN